MYTTFDHNPKMARKPKADNPWCKRFLPVRRSEENPPVLQLEDVKQLLFVSLKELQETKLALESAV